MIKAHTSIKDTANWNQLNAQNFKRLAEIRLSEARALLDTEKFDGAFYLAGYAVECALKACIANRTRPGDFPPEPTVVQNGFYTHNLETLYKTASKTGAFEDIQRQNLEFQKHWNVVKDWTEKSRYEIHDEKKARDMITSSHGVLECLKLHW
ncbi:MAG TPA: HEPN domain-containing protein [Terriglobia bacterium]|nr:HEPN domain-containing protein [Terriglobia bacterium]